jgi:hypothetical protein
VRVLPDGAEVGAGRVAAASVAGASVDVAIGGRSVEAGSEVGTGVSVRTMETPEAVLVGKAVFAAGPGWKGVGVAVELGSRVTRTSGGLG